MASYSYQSIEGRIDEALDSIHDGLYTNCSAAARAYDVPERTLQRRWNGGASRSTRASVNKALTDAQEQAIREYIARLDAVNMSARPRMIVGAANYLLKFEDRKVGHQWLSRFLKRNPDFHVRKQKPLAADRKNSHNVADMQSYFQKLETAMKEKGITEVDVWNMDETGFRIGCGRAQLVVTLDANKPLRMTDPDNRDYITSVECISSGGCVIPPLIIISGAQVLHKWCENDLDGDTLFATSESGYSNDDIALDWLAHFIEHTANKRRGAWLLLIIDGFGSHLTIPFFELATANRIALFRLPAHSTHLTQPLDVGVFQPFKHYHTEAIDQAVRLGDTQFSKLEFLAAFQTMRTQTFKSSTIRHAFRETGIVPLNPEMVLAKIRHKQAQSQTAFHTPSPPPLPLNQRTPQGPDSVVKYGQKLQRALAKMGPKDIINPEQLQQFIKGSITMAHKLELADRDLKVIQDATNARKKRASLGGTVAAKGGVIKASQCRELHSQRKQKEEEQARKKKEREEKKAERDRAKAQGQTKNPPRLSGIGQIEFLLNGPSLEE